MGKQASISIDFEGIEDVRRMMRDMTRDYDKNSEYNQFMFYILDKLTLEMWWSADGDGFRAGPPRSLAMITKGANGGGYSQAELNKLGNPYARRHGSIQINQPDKPWQINRQNYNLQTVRSMRWGGIIGWRGRINFNYDKVPYAKAVIMGTNVMLPRDTLRAWAESKKVGIQPYLAKRAPKHILRAVNRLIISWMQ